MFDQLYGRSLYQHSLRSAIRHTGSSSSLLDYQKLTSYYYSLCCTYTTYVACKYDLVSLENVLAHIITSLYELNALPHLQSSRQASHGHWRWHFMHYHTSLPTMTKEICQYFKP